MTKLPLLEEVDEEWRELTEADLRRLRSRSEPTADRALVELADRASLIGGTNDMSLVCLHDQGLTNDCQKNWGYYCTANGALKTTKPERDEGCDLCECISLTAKPVCFLGMTGALYCQRDLHDEGLLKPYTPNKDDQYTVTEEGKDKEGEISESETATEGRN